MKLCVKVQMNKLNYMNNYTTLEQCHRNTTYNVCCTVFYPDRLCSPVESW